MRWSICNEIFGDQPLDETFALVAGLGYEAVELAPYTLAEDPIALTPPQRRAIRDAASARGLGITGMHWLLAKTRGLHVSTADAGQAARTLDHLRGLTELCADLGGSVLVFGSPDQRSTPPGMSRQEAEANAVRMFRGWAETAERSGMTICLEALPAAETDFMTTTREVMAIVAQVDSPAVRMVLDVKSMSAENTPIPDLIRLAVPHLAYVQANDANRGGPGFGETDFVPIFAALDEVGYRGDVSVEAFDISTGALDVATRSIEYLRETARRAGWRS